MSYGRLGKGAKASAGTRDGTAGKQSGHAYLQWAFAAAAVLGLRHQETGQKDLARLAKQPGKGQALTRLAHTWARAVYARLQRQGAFAMATGMHGERRGGGSPASPWTARGCACSQRCAP